MLENVTPLMVGLLINSKSPFLTLLLNIIFMVQFVVSPLIIDPREIVTLLSVLRLVIYTLIPDVLLKSRFLVSYEELILPSQMLMLKEEVCVRDRGFLNPEIEKIKVGGSSEIPLSKPLFTIIELSFLVWQSNELVLKPYIVC